MIGAGDDVELSRSGRLRRTAAGPKPSIGARAGIERRVPKTRLGAVWGPDDPDDRTRG